MEHCEPVVEKKEKSLRERLDENLKGGLKRAEYMYKAAKILKEPVKQVVFSGGVNMRPKYY